MTGELPPHPFKDYYGNFIGGRWVDAADGRRFENPSPITGQTITTLARSSAADVEAALDAAHGAKDAWGRTSVGERALILNRIADRMEANLALLATAETWDNGKPIRETMAADMPLAIDHFRYFAGCIRAQEGGISEIDHDTVAYHFHEPLGVVGQIIPWNFPILMAVWKLAPALAAGNCVVLKPAEQTPASIHVLLELIADLLPPGVLNVVNGFGLEAGKPLALALAEAGWKTVIVEREHVGGTCINVGCTPTKTMVAGARVAYLARRAADYGVDTGPVRVELQGSIPDSAQLVVQQIPGADSDGEFLTLPATVPAGARVVVTVMPTGPYSVFERSNDRIPVTLSFSPTTP